MMSTLDLYHHHSHDKGPLFVEIIDRYLEVSQAVVIPAGAYSKQVFLAGGDYLVRVWPPAGDQFSLPVSIPPDGNAVVVLAPPDPSPHEFLQFEHFLGVTRRINRPGWNISSSAADESKRAVLPNGLWLRLWVWTGSDWLIGELASFLGVIARSPDAMKFRLKNDGSPLRLLQIGWPLASPRLVVLPLLPQEVNVALVALETTSDDAASGVKVIVTGLGEVTEVLSRYLNSGAANATRAVGETLAPHNAKEAEEMLSDKSEGPISGAIAGYYLLRVAAFDRLHNWPNDLAEQNQWLADGPIIRAWQILRDPKQHDPLRACRLLVQGAGRGFPVFTEGFRLLRDGLTYFDRIFPWTDPIADSQELLGGCRGALNSLNRYFAATDWEQPLTTFYGDGPVKPVSERTATHDYIESPTGAIRIT